MNYTSSIRKTGRRRRSFIPISRTGVSTFTPVSYTHLDVYKRQLQNNGMIKIITGMRRCGKYYLLFEIFNSYLENHGVAPNHIIKVDLDCLLYTSPASPLYCMILTVLDFPSRFCLVLRKCTSSRPLNTTLRLSLIHISLSKR